MANNFKNAGSSGLSTDPANPTVLYTAQNSDGPVNSILLELDIANTGTTLANVTILLNDSSAGTAYHIVKNAEVPFQGTLKVVAGQKIVLNQSDSIQIYSNSADMDALASILEDVA
jgi:hypothetical protein